MIDAARLDATLKAAGIPFADLGVGWTGARGEPLASYHTYKDGTVVRLLWPLAPTATQVSQADAAVQAYDPTPTFAEKLAALQQVAMTLAAVVQALTAANAAQPGLFASTPQWAQQQLEAAHAWITNQGG